MSLPLVLTIILATLEITHPSQGFYNTLLPDTNPTHKGHVGSDGGQNTAQMLSKTRETPQELQYFMHHTVT
jgi:hypothetical protein